MLQCDRAAFFIPDSAEYKGTLFRDGRKTEKRPSYPVSTEYGNGDGDAEISDVIIAEQFVKSAFHRCLISIHM